MRPKAERRIEFLSFSALQRAENSSMSTGNSLSSLRTSFSALQRAENSSILTVLSLMMTGLAQFQCSSASRKFLNRGSGHSVSHNPVFQCSSASRKFLNEEGNASSTISIRVSVLFSEPKIPQSLRETAPRCSAPCFSALQRAENSSIRCSSASASVSISRFQCSSASRKFLNPQSWRPHRRHQHIVSVLFSEPKIPQFITCSSQRCASSCFSALQRAENSSMCGRI